MTSSRARRAHDEELVLLQRELYGAESVEVPPQVNRAIVGEGVGRFDEAQDLYKVSGIARIAPESKRAERTVTEWVGD